MFIKILVYNCFLFFIPIGLWNVLFYNQLPVAFQTAESVKNVPAFLEQGEHVSRLLILTLSFHMPLKIQTGTQEKGLWLYLIGILIYFTSWLLLAYFPESSWSQSVMGFMAPAYTPILWLSGIGWVGNSFHSHVPFKRWYFFLLAFLFLVFHNAHTYFIYVGTHR